MKLVDFLDTVADPRRAQGKRYQLGPVLLSAILAILCGATSYRKMHRFMHAQRETLNAWFGFGWKRAPAYTAIRKILHALEVESLEQAFRVYSRELLERGDTPIPPTDEAPNAASRRAIALDGKVLRGSFDHFEDQSAAQVLSALCQQELLIVGHLPVADKSNEIPAAQQLMRELELRGVVYTLDALHCQKKRLPPPRAAVTR